MAISVMTFYFAIFFKFVLTCNESIYDKHNIISKQHYIIILYCHVYPVLIQLFESLFLNIKEIS